MPVPAVRPVRLPDPLMDALVLLILQVPPEVASLNVIMTPTHSDVAPCMGKGVGFTVTTCVVTQPPKE